MDEELLTPFKLLFNRNGYILNFSDYTFDEFTNKITGIRIQKKYKSSKGKSFESFLNDDTIDNSLKIKLLEGMLNYYRIKYKKNI